jgi:hypothetical protein
MPRILICIRCGCNRRSIVFQLFIPRVSGGALVYFYDFRRLPKPEAKFILISKFPPHFADKTVLFSAATEAVYQIQ